jgi:hypothetical protein
MQGLTKYLFTAMFVGQCIISIVFTCREVNGVYDDNFEYNLNLLFLYFVITVKCLSPMSFHQNWFIVTPSFLIAFIVHLVATREISNKITSFVTQVLFVMLILATNAIKYRTTVINFLSDAKIHHKVAEQREESMDRSDDGIFMFKQTPSDSAVGVQLFANKKLKRMVNCKNRVSKLDSVFEHLPLL